MSGYIKLYRSARGTSIAQHPEYFAAWVHLLLMATHKERQQVVGTKVVTLKPGQLIFGRLKFSANTGISENKVRSALTVMKELGMITSKSHAKFSVITIIKWSEYQGESPADNQHSTSIQPASHHKQECIKNEENEQEYTPLPPKGENVPFQEIVNLYHEHLPMLPRVANVSEPRKRAMRARWSEKVNVPNGKEVVEMKCNDLDFWARYFKRAATQPFLTGEKTDWAADFDFLLKKNKFIAVLEQRYLRD